MLLLASALGIFLNSSAAGCPAAQYDPQHHLSPAAVCRRASRAPSWTMLSSIVEHRNSLGLFGFLVLIWTALALFDSLRSVLHRVYYLKRTKGLIASLLHDVGFLFLAFIFFIVSNVAIWVSTLVERTRRRCARAPVRCSCRGSTKSVPTVDHHGDHRRHVLHRVPPHDRLQAARRPRP